jgi:two-component system, NarL family, nitrate/nitrite response regulator NarL
MADLRVLVVSDHPLVRAGLAAILPHTVEVVGQVSSAALADDVALYGPDALICDADLPPAASAAADNEAAEYIALLVELGLPCVLLIGDERDAPPLVALLRDEGMSNGYALLLRESGAPALAAALSAAVQGLVTLSPPILGALLAGDNAEPARPPLSTAPPPAPTPDLLTARERDVLALVAQGVTNKAIAQRLGISDSTVKFHVNAIMGKLNAQSRTDAVVRATRYGLLVL